MKVKRVKKVKAFDIVGVRFSSNPGHIWHYKVRKGVAYKGQELIVENDKGTSVVIVIQINPQTERELLAGGLFSELKWIRLKVVPL